MDQAELNRLLSAKERRRRLLAKLPIEEKIRAVIRLQEMAAPILRGRGRIVRCWRPEIPPAAE